tara:strand:+ start:2019 stop:3092 length:1074 start_codon:yes stop_codon:yes gene_type:complete
MSTTIRYNSEDIVIDTKRISTSTWADNTNNLGVAHTSSMQADQTLPSSQGNFFIDVYNMHTGSISASKEYSIAYGHRDGSGSLDFTNDEGSFGYSATRWNYSHYRQLVYGDELQEFNFNGFVPKDIWVINIERRNYKQNLKPGTLNMFLGESDTGAIIQLTDNSVTTTGSATLTMCGRQYDIVSGSSGQAIAPQKSNLSATIGDAQHGHYGYFYPDAGFIVLNPAALAETLGGSGNPGVITNLTPNETPNAPGFNIHKLLSSLQYGSNFILDSEEKVTSQYYFTRVKNSEFNYTTNPSFIDEQGSLRFQSMVDQPTVYITTVGLYSDAGELLAVAKLSKPLAKDFTKESLIKVKIDY